MRKYAFNTHKTANIFGTLSSQTLFPNPNIRENAQNKKKSMDAMNPQRRRCRNMCPGRSRGRSRSRSPRHPDNRLPPSERLQSSPADGSRGAPVHKYSETSSRATITESRGGNNHRSRTPDKGPRTKPRTTWGKRKDATVELPQLRARDMVEGGRTPAYRQFGAKTRPERKPRPERRKKRQNHLTILSVNVNGLPKVRNRPTTRQQRYKNYLLANLCAERQPDVLCVQETHFAEGDTLDASFLPG